MSDRVRDGLARLGVRRLVLAIHDASFPADPDEDIGRGSPATRAAQRLYEYARGLGFTAIQLGPQGQTSRGNPSPYDSTMFTRNLANIGFAGLVAPHELEPWLVPFGPARHAHAYDASHAIVAAAYAKSDGRSDLHTFGQRLAQLEHLRVRRIAGLEIWGDMHIGYAAEEAAEFADVFLHGWFMGAPPSRTNPEGQPWGYPVLDPDQLAGAAGELVTLRAETMFRAYDGIRIDHPHGLVCPWVYRDNVREGARLYESPDRPELARYAIARADQIDTTKPRYADDWVRALDDAQVERYAILIDAIVDAAARAGRSRDDLSCEVLSTMPYPLGRVLARHGLGRWRVTAKANLDDPRDVYRAELAERPDWVMLGNHDTAPIRAVIAAWPPDKRETWARHLAATLHLAEPARLADDRFLANAMLAELFASRAENVSIFFADLFGLTERYNVPGLISETNWTLRLPPDFERLDQGLDIALAVELALGARQLA